MGSLNVRALDPGVRELVVWLNDHGFETVDSGDGVSKPETGRCFNHPHVFMQVSPAKMVTEALRLVQLLRSRQVLCSPVGYGACVEATFDPVDGSALLGLHHVTSGMIERKS